jgi:tRNA pseudouridine55 synthase
MLRQSGIKRKQLPKFGHGGTLDPFATGVLMVLIGRGTKFAQDFLHGDKTYEACLNVGLATRTGDIEGDLVKEGPRGLPLQRWEQAALEFVNIPYEQVPPMYSAKQMNGQRLYDLARKGKVVERAPVLCDIEELKILSSSDDELYFRVCCSSGTFVRVLGEDLAAKVGTVGHLKTLRRIASGDKCIERSLTLDEVQDHLNGGECISELSSFYSLEELLCREFRWECPEDAYSMLCHGNDKLLRLVDEQWPKDVQRVVVMYHGKIAAVAERRGQGANSWTYRAVFCSLSDTK